MTPQELLDDMLSFAIPTDKAIEWLHAAIVIGKEAERVAQEQDRRRAWRERAAREDLPESVREFFGGK